MKDVTCPAKTLHPKLGNWHSDSNDNAADMKKRALGRVVEGMLLKRDDECSNDMWVRLLQYSGVLFGHSSENMKALQSIWDEEFAGHYDYQLTYSNLTEYFTARPSIDRSAVLEWIFWDPIDAGPGIRAGIHLEKLFCSAGSEDKSNRDLFSRAGVHEYPRTINSGFGNAGSQNAPGIPAWETILAGIQNGDLSLHYARWEFENSGQYV